MLAVASELVAGDAGVAASVTAVADESVALELVASSAWAVVVAKKAAARLNRAACLRNDDMVVLLNKMMSFYYILFCSEWIRFLIFYILQIDEFRKKMESL